jgi:hypothetical protein
MMSNIPHHNERCVMKTIPRVVLASLLVFGLTFGSSLALAGESASNQDRGGQHRLLNAELRAKLERVEDKLKDHRENHDQGGVTGSLGALQSDVASLKSQLAALASNEASLLSQLNAANSQIALLTSQISALQTSGGSGGTNPVITALAKYVTVDPNMINGVKGPHVIFTGVNVHVRSGSGFTGDNGAPLGLGNLIVGYNEGPPLPPADPTNGRTGSHNIVGGTLNAFTSAGGIVLGSGNWTQNMFSSVLGGEMNQAQGLGSSILGGRGSTISSSDQTLPPMP